MDNLRNLYIKVLFAFLIGSIGIIPVQAQREKNNIYLFDCTGSMKTNKLWEPAKQSLEETINLQASQPGSTITIIPFGDNPYEVFSFPAEDFPKKKGSVLKAFDKYITEAQYTHISDVMKKGLEFIDENKDNRVYLLTDGQPNHGDNTDSVAKVISNWCGTHKNARFFYVALVKNALDSKIRKVLDNCPGAFIVELDGNVIPQFIDLSTEIYTNLEELDEPRYIDFSLPGKYPVTVSYNDPYFDVKIIEGEAKEGKIGIRLTPKYPVAELHEKLAGSTYEFPITIKTNDRKYYIVNPVVDVYVADKIQSKLSVAGGYDEIATPGVKWHDSFLWSNAAPDETVNWNLLPVFENQLSNSALNVKFESTGIKEKDFQAWYNGQSIEDGSVLTISPDRPAELSVMFDHKAKEGKRYFKLTPVGSRGLDLVNDQPVEDYGGTSLRTVYTVGWNPVAIVFFWICIAILVFLILWFLFLQRIFYPRIKVGKVEFTGPSSYYSSKKIKGARKVVLTSGKKKQNVFSRIFTGEVRYVKADHFIPELEILPSGGKKKVKVRNTGKATEGWEIYPSAIFGQYDKGTLKNKSTKEETQLEFS